MDFPAGFKDVFISRYKTTCGYMGSVHVLKTLWSSCDFRLRRCITKCTFPWKLVMRVLEVDDMDRYYYDCFWGSLTYQKFRELLRQNMVRILLWKRVFRVFIRHCVEWYRHRVLVKAHIIARNKKDNLPDQIMEMRYHPVHDMYFEGAFSGRFTKNLEKMPNGTLAYVIHVSRMGTTQEAIALYCLYTCNPWEGRLHVKQFIEDSATDTNRLERVIQILEMIGRELMKPSFSGLCAEYLHTYIEETLLQKKGMNSTQRLERFIRQNPVLAEYIWKGNFASETRRETLGSQLQISKRNMGGFKRSSTLAELREFVDRKLNKKDSLLDQLPPHVWKKIENAENALASARGGVRVGLFGHYISSDAVTAAQTRLREAWKEADRWIGRQLLQQSRS